MIFVNFKHLHNVSEEAAFFWMVRVFSSIRNQLIRNGILLPLKIKKLLKLQFFCLFEIRNFPYNHFIPKLDDLNGVS